MVLLGFKLVALVVGELDVVNAPGMVAVIGPFRTKQEARRWLGSSPSFVG